MKKTTKYIFSALFAALIAILAQICIPLPSGIPLTLQTFAVALCGFLLSCLFGTLSVVVYVLLGLIGLPVFSAFGGGPVVLFGATGGFLWGFLILSFTCALSEKFDNRLLKFGLITIGILLCHLCGILQFSIVYNTTFGSAFLLVSLPYLLKDFICVFGAFWVAKLIKKRIKI